MKKIKILSFASLPLAMALLAGCGHQHTFSEEWNHDANKHWHDATCEHKDQVSEEGEHVFGDDNICDVCGYDKGGEPGPGPGPGPGPQPEIDHTVTAEEWSAFWDTSKPFYIADNYKATMVMTADGQSGSQTSVMTVDGNKAKFEGLIDGAAAQLDYCEFISKGNYKHYEYDKTAEKWYYEVGSNNPADDFAMQLQPFFTMTGFTYDEASKSYKKESSGTYSNLVIQFGAKKVTSYSFNFLMPVGPGVTMPVKMEGTFDYNGQVVTLPEPAEPAHVHNYNQLKYDEYSHWNACECGEREPYSGGAHFDADWDCKCDVCEYAMPVEVEPGYWMLIKDGGGYCSLEENPDKAGEFMTDMYFEENAQFSLFDVTDSAYNRFSELTLSDDEKTSATGVTISEGVVTIHEAGPYMFYLNPSYNEGKGILYVAKNEGPVVDEPVYGYSYNNGDYQSMIDCGKGAQWQLLDFYMAEKDTIKFADILNPEFPIEITYLEDNGNLQGFTNVDGILTCGADGYYCFTLNVDEYGNASIVIGIGEEPAPLIDVYLMGDFDEWTSGMIMQLNSGSYTEYVIKNVHISAGGKFKVRQGTEDSGYCGTWKEEGEKNALNSGLLVLDNGDAKALVDIIVDVYYESAIEGGQGFGTYVELNSVARAYKGVGSYRGVDEKISFDFDKVENGYAQYFVNIPEGYVSTDFVYSITRYDNLVEGIVVEQVDEGLKFVRQADNTFKYSGTATTLDLYLKVYLDGSGIGLYVSDPSAEPVTYNTLYLNPGDWANDGATFYAFFFDSTKTNPDLWIALIQEDSLYKVDKVEGYDKVIFVRCDPSKDPFVDGWDAKWNQTDDLDVPADANVKCTITGWGEPGENSTVSWGTK